MCAAGVCVFDWRAGKISDVIVFMIFNPIKMSFISIKMTFFDQNIIYFPDGHMLAGLPL